MEQVLQEPLYKIYSGTSEDDLVIQLKDRNVQAYSTLYNLYSAALFTKLKKLVQITADAEDLLQITFIKIWEKIDTYDPNKGRLFTWMLNITKNLAIDHLRSNTNCFNMLITSLSYAIEFEKSTIYGNEYNFDLKVFLLKMKPESRMLLFLSFFYGYSHSQIATLLSQPLGTIKTKIKAAYRDLKKIIDEVKL